ncbi:unnamed protein product, partial [Nesidiocoris tenuis]
MRSCTSIREILKKVLTLDQTQTSSGLPVTRREKSFNKALNQLTGNEGVRSCRDKHFSSRNLKKGSKGSIGSAPVSPLLPHRSSSRRHPLTSAANRARSADPAPFTAKTRKYSDSSPGGLSEPDSGLLSALESGSATNTRSPSDSSEETTAWPPPPSEIQ